MTKKSFNILITVLIWLFFIYIGFVAAVQYTKEPETKPVDTTQTETLNCWKQSVNAELQKHNIKVGETK